MCSIMGYKGDTLTEEQFKEHFDKTISRGPDMQRIEKTGDVTLGFERLAIMGLTEEGMQPFVCNGNKIVCNGEIYGFRKIKKELEKEYEFKSDSDCEILLPLYEKYGVEMFRKLDAEFACILYDAKTGEALSGEYGIMEARAAYDGDKMQAASLSFVAVRDGRLEKLDRHGTCIAEKNIGNVSYVMLYEDAIVVDSSNMTFDETVKHILHLVQERI